MSDFIDYVLVQNKFDENGIYTAPCFSKFNPGDELLVEGASYPVKVVDSLTVGIDSNVERFITSILQAKPPKVLQRIEYKDMEWGA